MNRPIHPVNPATKMQTKELDLDQLHLAYSPLDTCGEKSGAFSFAAILDYIKEELHVNLEDVFIYPQHSYDGGYRIEYIVNGYNPYMNGDYDDYEIALDRHRLEMQKYNEYNKEQKKKLKNKTEKEKIELQIKSLKKKLNSLEKE